MGEESNIQNTNTQAVEPNTQPADTKPADNNTPADTKPADAGTPTQEPKATEPHILFSPKTSFPYHPPPKEI